MEKKSSVSNSKCGLNIVDITKAVIELIIEPEKSWVRKIKFKDAT